MDPAELLRDLVKLDTTNPPGNEDPAAEVLEAELSAAGLQTDILRSPEGRPNLVARLEGPGDAPALVLLSHTDVVPVESERWTRDPFGGDVHDGHLYGRGTLDMKGIAAMHAIAAMRAGALHDRKRELIVCAVADEEAGGRQGARWLAEEHPEQLGFDGRRRCPEALGEGAYGLSGILDIPVMPIVLGEKTALWVKLEAEGDPGHGSLPPNEQAIARLVEFIDRIAGHSTPRIHPVMREQFAALGTSGDKRALLFRALASPAGPIVARALATKLHEAGAIGALLSDTVTPTQFSAGYKHNVVPAVAEASLDCRLLPDADREGFVARLRKRAEGRRIRITAGKPGDGPVSTPGPLFSLLKEVSQGLSEAPVVAPSLTAGFTDLRFLRRLGATCYGWVPLVLSEDLLRTIHGHDERIPLDGFSRAVDAMTEVVTRALDPSSSG